ncbi:M23 family metallopeptidase [Elioraea tepidiphila]|jgi:murein DD-endopeptidase MepM/ murein hydrolase activator NlpD|uniref:M23 family metallopeptidase n=1 Tax=Elioraea tepidiphila TaxID=457934 RepID=UPI002FD95596
MALAAAKPAASVSKMPPPLSAFRSFPLHKRPAFDWHVHPRNFGTTRSSGRKHAGCDLYAPTGTKVLAVADGTIIGFGRFKVVEEFPDLVGAIEVEHEDGWIARYCEVARTLAGALKVGSSVKAGEVIGEIGHLMHKLPIPSDMLHFELYGGWETGSLSQPGVGAFHRRADLLDPTAYLDACAPPA